ncbi:MAG: BatD family protein [Polyangiaceae bacterium]|nr:BatD family protein [Polyangiaceae bacterium]MCW5789118.1 BatD family protein [Polyangiaceae bacterium]
MAAFLTAFAISSLASAAPRLQTDISRSTVEANEAFTVTLTIQDADNPRQPTLKLPPGFDQRGPAISTRSQISVRGGRITQSQGISATWTLVAKRPGTYVLGPASVQVGDRRYSGEVLRVRVVAAGSAPRGRSNFDPFGVLRGFPGFGDEDEPLEDLIPPPPDEFRMDSYPDSVAFLRAEVKPARAVVGEPIVYRVFAYGSRGPFNEHRATEASRPDFLAYPVTESSFGGELHRVQIADRTFHAIKLREVILVPLRSGDLVIGPMSAGFGGPAYGARQAGGGLQRESESITVRVTEPPADNRPTGYTLGDVGTFSLSARVEPRTLKQGESVSVIVRLEGQGNLPSALKPPQRMGVEWLEPNVKEQIDPRGGSLGGWRRFSYTARITTTGEVELGAFTLPFWNPTRRRYETIEATLGSVRVDPNPDLVDEPSVGEPKIEVAPRAQLSPMQRHGAPLTDQAPFWLALFGAPLSLLLVRLGGRAGARLRAGMKRRSQAAGTLAAEALAKAAAATKAGAPRDAASEYERALLHATEGATGIRARGVLRAELQSTLEGAGVEETLASELVQLLELFDAVRFTGEALPEDTSRRVRQLVSQLEKLGRRSGGAA